MTHLDQFNEYAEKAAPRGSTLYYSLLFTPKPQRQIIIALNALRNELNKITEQQTEKNILQAKLQWWQQEIQRIQENQAQHPIAKVLATEKSLSPVLLQEWIDGALMKLDCDHLCTEKDLSFFCYREYGICAILAAYSLGFKHQSSLKGVQDLAESVAIISLINHFEQHLQQGHCFLPLDWLEQHHVTDELLHATSITPELKAVFLQLTDLAKTKFDSGMEKIANEDKATLLPIIIQATINEKTRQELIKADFPIFHQYVTLTPIRKLFTAIQAYWQV